MTIDFQITFSVAVESGGKMKLSPVIFKAPWASVTFFSLRNGNPLIGKRAARPGYQQRELRAGFTGLSPTR